MVTLFTEAVEKKEEQSVCPSFNWDTFFYKSTFLDQNEKKKEYDNEDHEIRTRASVDIRVFYKISKKILLT